MEGWKEGVRGLEGWMDEGSEGMRGMDGYRGREGMRRTRLGEGKREWRDEGRDGGRERERRMRWSMEFQSRGQTLLLRM